MSDPKSIVRTYHSIDPVTGFVQSTGNYPNPFDSERKKAFLEMYKTEGIRLRRTCRSMGLSEATVNHHLQIDPIFKEQFDGVERDYIEELEATSRTNALNPNSVIERKFQLRCLLPLKYGLENRPIQQTVTINLGPAQENVSKRQHVIDAEVVREVEAGESASLENPVG